MTRADAEYLAKSYGVTAEAVLDHATGAFSKRMVDIFKADYAKYRDDMWTFFVKYDQYSVQDFYAKVIDAYAAIV